MDSSTSASVKLLVGTKCDLEEDRTVPRIQAQKVADEIGIRYIEASAREGQNVEEAFNSVIHTILVKKGILLPHPFSPYATPSPSPSPSPFPSPSVPPIEPGPPDTRERKKSISIFQKLLEQVGINQPEALIQNTETKTVTSAITHNYDNSQVQNTSEKHDTGNSTLQPKGRGSSYRSFLETKDDKIMDLEKEVEEANLKVKQLTKELEDLQKASLIEAERVRQKAPQLKQISKELEELKKSRHDEVERIKQEANEKLKQISDELEEERRKTSIHKKEAQEANQNVKRIAYELGEESKKASLKSQEAHTRLQQLSNVLEEEQKKWSLREKELQDAYQALKRTYAEQKEIQKNSGLQEANQAIMRISNELEEERRKAILLEQSIKKEIASDLLNKAFQMLEEERPSLAKCYLNISTDIYESPDDSGKRHLLSSEIQIREHLTEYELQTRIEAKVEAVKTQIVHAEHQVSNVRSEEEEEMIVQQLEVLRNQEKELNAQLRAIEIRNKELQEREQRVLQREQLISEQTQHLEQLLADLIATSSGIDTTVLKQQMNIVVSGDKDVDAARRRFAGLQKAAKDAQQTLIVEERRQRERVEWLQKQMDLYRVKGMSPAQLTYRNFLKDIKRLSTVRNRLDHVPHPLRCFISYAWETDQMANKELQQRLQKLKEDLELAGMKVTLDVCNMKDSMKTFMVKGIENAHKMLLVCTPTKNNLQLELETAVTKSLSTPEFIVPLIFAGDHTDALPPQVEDLLAINFSHKLDIEADHIRYYESIASLAPMGLIPMLLDLPDNKEYKSTAARFFGDLKDYGLIP